jgi:hypothetical protein
MLQMAALSVCEFELFSLNLEEKENEKSQCGSVEAQTTTNTEQIFKAIVWQSSNELAVYAKSIRELALKCDEKLKIAIDTAEENARLRAQLSELKGKMEHLQVFCLSN